MVIYLKNRELDRLIAEHIFGWVDFCGNGDYLMGYPPYYKEKYDIHLDVPNYSTDIRNAWEVVEKLKSNGLEISIITDTESTECVISHNLCSLTEADTPQLAICLCALKYAGVDFHEEA